MRKMCELGNPRTSCGGFRLRFFFGVLGGGAGVQVSHYGTVALHAEVSPDSKESANIAHSRKICKPPFQSAT